MTGRSLIVVMAGDNSIHERSFHPTDACDLWVIYYGANDEVAERYRRGSTRFFPRRGLKMDLMRSVLLAQHLDGSVDYRQYEYIFIPDDDVDLPGGMATLQWLFSIGRQWRLDAFQPAIQNEYYSLGSTLRIPDALLHQVNWPEIMMPAFTPTAFVDGLLAALHLNFFSSAGWGLEPASVRLSEFVLRRGFRCAVIDSIPAVHTRPAGLNKNLYQRGYVEGFMTGYGHGFGMETLRIFAEGADPSEWPDAPPAVIEAGEVARAVRKGYYHMRLSRLARYRPIRKLIDLVSGPPPRL